MKNDQTYFKNLAVFTPQEFSGMCDYFFSLCMKVFTKAYEFSASVTITIINFIEDSWGKLLKYYNK